MALPDASALPGLDYGFNGVPFCQMTLSLDTTGLDYGFNGVPFFGVAPAVIPPAVGSVGLMMMGMGQ